MDSGLASEGEEKAAVRKNYRQTGRPLMKRAPRVIDGMGLYKTKAMAILDKNGIKEPKPGSWYSQASWLNAFKEIYESIGSNTLYSIRGQNP